MTAAVAKPQASFHIPEDRLQRIRAALQVLQEELMPYLPMVTARKRRAMLKLGMKKRPFVDETLHYMRVNPQLKPPYMDLDEFARELEAGDTLLGIEQVLKELLDAVSGGVLQCGSDALSRALVCYQSLRIAANAGEPFARTIYNDLSRSFPGRPTKASIAAAKAKGRRGRSDDES